jgi:hypothetical protein
MSLSSGGLALGGPVARATLLLAVCLLVFAAIALQFAQVRALYGGDESTAERVNCPSCGARTPAESRPERDGGAVSQAMRATLVSSADDGRLESF